MLADAEPEAPPARRLLVFAGCFLGLLALAQANFSRPLPLIAPPVALAIVLLVAAAGLLVWIRGRWSRALLMLAAGIATMAGAAAAAILQTVPTIALVLVLVGTAGLACGSVLVVATIRDWWPTARRRATWGLGIAATLIGVMATPVAGARLGVITAWVALLLAWLLRPVRDE